jgi:predicted Zn-dependent protease
VSRGLLALSNSEDELANVLAHEVVHVASRHAAARQHIVRGVPGLLQLLQIGDLAAYGRDQERVADRLGQEVAAAAGYDPKAMAGFLRSLEFAERLRRGASRLPSYLDTHPPPASASATPTRARRAFAGRRRRIAPTRETSAPARRPGARHQRRQGVFHRERFVHPDLGFSVRFRVGDREHPHRGRRARAGYRSAALMLEGGGHGVSVEEAAIRHRSRRWARASSSPQRSR